LRKLCGFLIMLEKLLDYQITAAMLSAK